MRVMCFARSKVTWAHGSLLFHSGKKRSRHSKISVSSKGCVRIKKISEEDEGVYTCMGESDESSSVHTSHSTLQNNKSSLIFSFSPVMPGKMK